MMMYEDSERRIPLPKQRAGPVQGWEKGAADVADIADGLLPRAWWEDAP